MMARLTKGAFFHHFRNKNDLARALIRRFADEGLVLFRENLARAIINEICITDPRTVCSE
jgi:AcrR family transcriptional regulator